MPEWDEAKDKLLLSQGYGRPDGYAAAAVGLGFTEDEGRARFEELMAHRPDLLEEAARLAAADPTATNWTGMQLPRTERESYSRRGPIPAPPASPVAAISRPEDQPAAEPPAPEEVPTEDQTADQPPAEAPPEEAPAEEAAPAEDVVQEEAAPEEAPPEEPQPG